MNFPEPLIASEVDLQDFSFMPLQVSRLRDSDLAALEDPEACWYAVLLWAASWHQIPAGSLPDNDAALMRLVGLGRDARTWKKHRAGALRGFVQCSDGRLYHPVVVEQAKEAWNRKLQQNHRTFCSAVRKHNERNPDNKLNLPTFEQWEELGRPERVAHLVTRLSNATRKNVVCDNGSNRQGQGQGQGQGHIDIPPNPQNDEPSVDATQPDEGGAKEYAFEGKTVRLNQVDLDNWRKAYHAIPDLHAELVAVDGWWQRQAQDKRKDWFYATSSMLNRKHQDALRSGSAPQSGNADFNDYLTQRRREQEAWEAAGGATASTAPP
ncbi:MAG: DUF1376 domain-containing protein [Novosphingobium sp.]|nr:DUF1376 domain-containing protein [Novosphingobium sp.]